MKGINLFQRIITNLKPDRMVLTNYHPERPRAFGLRKTNIAYARNLSLEKNK